MVCCKIQIKPFEDHYMLAREDHPDVSKRSSHHLTRSLLDFDEVRIVSIIHMRRLMVRGVLLTAS